MKMGLRQVLTYTMEKRGLTQAQLGELLGIGQQGVSLWLRSERYEKAWTVFKKIAKLEPTALD